MKTTTPIWLNAFRKSEARWREIDRRKNAERSSPAATAPAECRQTFRRPLAAVEACGTGCPISRHTARITVICRTSVKRFGISAFPWTETRLCDGAKFDRSAGRAVIHRKCAGQRFSVRPADRRWRPEITAVRSRSRPRRTIPCRRKRGLASSFPSSVPEPWSSRPVREAEPKVLPDCEIESGCFRDSPPESLAAGQGIELSRIRPAASRFRRSKTGAFRLRPLRRTPASPTRGKTTRSAYAITKFRLVWDIALFTCPGHLRLRSAAWRSMIIQGIAPSRRGFPQTLSPDSASRTLELGAECVRGQIAQQLVPRMLLVLFDLGHHLPHLSSTGGVASSYTSPCSSFRTSRR